MQAGEDRQGGGYPRHAILFEVVKKLEFGKAMYLCGSLRELGEWNPRGGLRLEWREGDKWWAELPLTGELLARAVSFQFKLLISEWQLGDYSEFQWQVGSVNRRINIQSIFQGSNLYSAEWNMQHYIFFLRTEDYEEQEAYFMEGSVEGLGCWREKRAMKRLGPERGSPFINYWKNNPQFAEIFMLSLSVGREVDSFRYFYVCFGSSIESEGHPGRSVSLRGGEAVKDRIMQFDWQGSRVIIDESTFDQMILQRFTNQIYLASEVHSLRHLHRIVEKKVTVVVQVMAKEEEYRISCFNLRNLCKERGVRVEGRTLDEVDSLAFEAQVNAIVDEVDSMIVHGHRACLILSNRVMRMLPIHMLYLILFSGCSFGEALEIVSRREKPPESQCRKAREIYNFVSAKFLRGRAEMAKQ